MSSEAARCWSPPCSLLGANCHVSVPSDKHITFYLGSLGEPAYRCETHFPSCLRIHRHGQSPHLVCHERSLTGAVLFIRIVGPRSGYSILNVPRPRAHLIGSCQAAAWRPGWFLESIRPPAGRGFCGCSLGSWGVSVPEETLGSLSTRREEFQVGLGPGAAGQHLRRGWGTHLDSTAPRIHASVPSLPGLSLSPICYGILCKEPRLSGPQFPQLSHGKRGPVPLE